ncbi:DUF2127 domain-containing protein [Actinocrinis puniceicyclus]|uniref:DUF2127 domain-containing protein n=2 Tax=Actinocrinis puniceicyclus TaxID=977794 RepID=A0A8J7WLB5_9ACTN|nr:DUF2127 domain-containing protein [Actinocrinis puniceicyclus]MBS2961832.1 DUF2127 domain-containing protein [Actinocrinis puniceicyclus]
MDWNRRHCARRGHVLYEPLEPEYRDRIRTETAVGTAWRCLRCGDFVLEAPRGSGPAQDAPVIPRGKALRSLLIMRVLAVERVFRFLLVGAAAYAVWRFENSQRALSQLFENDLTLLKPLATHWGYDLDHSSIVDTIRKSFNYKHSTLTVVAILLVVYAAIELIEAIGLWLAKRWGEYFAVVATAAFLPIEIDEIITKQSPFKIATFVVNVLAVLYLLLAKRLFGLRGGKAAAERELHSASLLEIEEATGETDRHGQVMAEATARERVERERVEARPEPREREREQVPPRSAE